MPRALFERLHAGARPQHNTPQEQRRQRSAPDDLTDLSAPPLTYTAPFLPTVAPLAREVVYNALSREGELYIKSRAPKRVEEERDEALVQCIGGIGVARVPSATRSLSVGVNTWASPRDLNPTCLSRLGARRGAHYFMATVSLKGWRQGETRSISSVSPEQRLISMDESPFSLFKDQSDSFYLKAHHPLKGLADVSFFVSAPSPYFSASWRFKTPVGETLARALKHHAGEPARLSATLPLALQQQASNLTHLFEVDPNTPYQDALYRLVEWHRSFKLGELPKDDSSLYERLTRAQRGVCRHRAYAFVISARALGIPARFVSNTAHAFAEVVDPLGRWRRIDLGGEGPFVIKEVKPDLKQVRAQSAEHQARDGLPTPAPYLNAQEEATERLKAFYQLNPAQQQALTQPAPPGALNTPNNTLNNTLHEPNAQDTRSLGEVNEGEQGGGADGLLVQSQELMGVGARYTPKGRLISPHLPQSSPFKAWLPGPPTLPLKHKRTSPSQRPVKHTPRASHRPPLDSQRTQPPQECPTTEEVRAPKGWRPTGSLTPRETVSLAQLPPLKHLELHARLSSPDHSEQCGWVRVKGTLKPKKGARLTRSQRKALRGVTFSLRGALTEVFYPLNGEARLNRRGGFDITARFPLRLPLGFLVLQVVVALPGEPPFLFTTVMK